mmetsp:Transcript_30564/g.34753  ORF Transcript_30564/g.34753 Transcript_30564/m.34753 type:complete len:132 (+) Transcript_30564:210-605(+)
MLSRWKKQALGFAKKIAKEVEGIKLLEHLETPGLLAAPTPKNTPQGEFLRELPNELTLYTCPTVEEEPPRAKVILVVGETGSGKSTMINSIVNSYMGIQYSDSFRYCVVPEGSNQAKSQTKSVEFYPFRAE